MRREELELDARPIEVIVFLANHSLPRNLSNPCRCPIPTIPEAGAWRARRGRRQQIRARPRPQLPLVEEVAGLRRAKRRQHHAPAPRSRPRTKGGAGNVILIGTDEEG